MGGLLLFYPHEWDLGRFDWEIMGFTWIQWDLTDLLDLLKMTEPIFPIGNPPKIGNMIGNMFCFLGVAQANPRNCMKPRMVQLLCSMDGIFDRTFRRIFDQLVSSNVLLICNEWDKLCSITIVILDVHGIIISNDTTGFAAVPGKSFRKQRVLPPNSFGGSDSLL